MDAYSNVKGQAENADSLFMQMYNMHRRWAQFKRGERVRLNDIWDALLRDWNMDDEKMLASKRRLLRGGFVLGSGTVRVGPHMPAAQWRM